MDGGGKFSTAALLVALGAVGALVFSRREPEPSPEMPAASSSYDTLVRRTVSPIALVPQPESPAISEPFSSATSAAAVAGRSDPVAGPGIDARPRGRLAAQYPPDPTSFEAESMRYAGSAASLQSADPERTPLHNLATTPSLPARYPAARLSNEPAAESDDSPAAGVAKLRLAPPAAAAIQAEASPASPQRFAVMTPIGPREVSPAAASRTVPPPSAVENTTTPVPATGTEAPRFVPTRSHKVRDGDTLAGLAERYYGDASRCTAIFEANRKALANPDVLPIGTVLVIPTLGGSLDNATAPNGVSAQTPAARLLPKLQIRDYSAPENSSVP